MGKRGPTSHEEKVQQLKDFIQEVICENCSEEQLSKNGLAHSERKHSAGLIQQKYGSGCAELFRIIYTQWVRGGRTLSGVNYKTKWVITPKHAEALLKLMSTRDENSTAKEWVKILKEQGFEETARGRQWNDEGKLVSDKILTKDENKELIKVKREARLLEKDARVEKRSQKEATMPQLIVRLKKRSDLLSSLSTF